MESYMFAKQKMLGNIKFIGELGKLDMLHEGILHKCIKQLLEKKSKVLLKDTSEDMECLCQIMRTVGHRLDVDKAKAWMDQYFERIKSFVSNEELPARIRFMLKDTVELREANWNQRKIRADNGPKTIHQIREEAAKDHGVYFPLRTGGPRNRDIFGSQNSNMIDFGGNVGKGPGIIQMENYDYGTQGYRNNKGNYNRRENSPQGSPKQYRHNNQGQQQQQQGQIKQMQNLPPRLQRKMQQQQQHSGGNYSMDGGGNMADDISLRPTVNFSMFKPQTPNMLPKSSQYTGSLRPGSGSSAMQQALLQQKQPEIPIKQASSQEKSKSKKNQQLQQQQQQAVQNLPSKDDLRKTTEVIITDLLLSQDVEKAVTAFKKAKVPDSYMPEGLSYMISRALDQSDIERDLVSNLISSMYKNKLITPLIFMEAFETLLSQMEDLEVDVPLVKSYLAKFAAQAIDSKVISLTNLATPLANGMYYPLFMLCLQQMQSIGGQDCLTSQFGESKIDLLSLLPEVDRNRARMMEILKDRDLDFLFPLVRIENDLGKIMMSNPGATELYKWIKENVNEKLYLQPGFIEILITSIVQFVTTNSTLGKGVDASLTPDKALQEKEKELLTKYKSVLQRFLHDQLSLQIAGLYALQVFAHSNGFPKGLLLRMFMNLYDLEVFEDESYMKWKEEVDSNYPGKGKALFQVNQWLTWLEQAEEESEDDEDDE